MFAALDMRTNELVWQQHWADTCYSGSTTTAGGLVFVGRNDGRLTALDSGDGTKLWEFQTGAGMNAPVSVFEHEGKQYVVAYSAGNLFAGSPKGDSVWLFGLDGTLEPAPPRGRRDDVHARSRRHGRSRPPASRLRHRVRRSVTASKAKAVTAAASRCRRRGQRRRRACKSSAKAATTMPPFGAALTPEQIRDVAAYVATMLPH